MQSLASVMNAVWGILAIAAQLWSLAILASIVSRRAPAFVARAASLASKNAVLVSLAASALATLGSLVYSDVIGYEPCKLCWFQRVFMYPQVIVLGLALWKKDSSVRRYALALSVAGGLVALFHYAGQLGINPLGLDCLAVGYSASCAKNFVLQFGYITIPLMSFSAFAFMSLSLWKSLKDDRAEAR